MMPTEQEIRAGNLNVIDLKRHAVRCPFVSDHSQICDCSPLDDRKAMRGADVLLIFAPLPPEEAAALRSYSD